MTDGRFVSYAQHGEDVVLWRALGPRTDVFYVDVGAYHPTIDSVTRALYERGWRGMNIEAQADRIPAFEEERPEDINLALAIGDHDGTASLTVPGNPGWASLLEPGATGADASTATTVEVPLRSLATVLAEHSVDHVDVLKVDVEGAEPGAVRGMLAGPTRPTVCVIEGVAPGVGRAAGDEAVALLVEAGYTHCQFDGLNHYLTTDDRVVEPLSVPANPLDDFVTDLVDRMMRERVHHIGSIAALSAENLRLRTSSAPGDLLADAPTLTTDIPEWDVAGSPAPGDERPTSTKLVRDRDRDQADAEPPRSPTVAPEPLIDRGTRRSRRREMLIRLLRGGGVPPLPTPAVGITQLEPSLERLAPSEAVSILYQIILGRTPDPEGLAGWVRHIEDGTPLLTVTQELARSDEAKLQSEVHRARVRADLGAWGSLVALGEIGAPDPASAEYSPGSVAHEILVRALYEVALGRQPTHDELRYQVRILADGASRETMTRGFAGRHEARARLLGRRRYGMRGIVRTWRDHRAYLPTFRSMVAAAEDRQIAQLVQRLSLTEALRAAPSRRQGGR